MTLVTLTLSKRVTRNAAAITSDTDRRYPSLVGEAADAKSDW
jgi:hypothetical protein